jgi:hypothetical protein
MEDIDRIKEVARMVSVGAINDVSRGELEYLYEAVVVRLKALKSPLVEEKSKMGRPVGS